MFLKSILAIWIPILLPMNFLQVISLNVWTNMWLFDYAIGHFLGVLSMRIVSMFKFWNNLNLTLVIGNQNKCMMKNN
jgi:hypothetical protein